jgi:hypothetical protein
VFLALKWTTLEKVLGVGVVRRWFYLAVKVLGVGPTRCCLILSLLWSGFLFSHISLGVERCLNIGWVVSFGGFDCCLLFVVV